MRSSLLDSLSALKGTRLYQPENFTSSPCLVAAHTESAGNREALRVAQWTSTSDDIVCADFDYTRDKVNYVHWKPDEPAALIKDMFPEQHSNVQNHLAPFNLAISHRLCKGKPEERKIARAARQKYHELLVKFRFLRSGRVPVIADRNGNLQDDFVNLCKQVKQQATEKQPAKTEVHSDNHLGSAAMQDTLL